MAKLVRIWLFLATLLLASGAEAAPMYSSLATVRAESKTVVIGRVSFVGDEIIVDADTVLRGGRKPGRFAVGQSPDGHVALRDRKRVVVFVDGNGAFRWVGGLLAGPSLEKGVIKLQGFFDFNAHIVSPGVMSLAQLRRYLKTGQLRQRFAGTLAFPDGHGGLRPSARHFTVDYEPLAKKVAVSGLNVACLDGKKPGLFRIDWGRVDMALGSSCRGTARSLWLDGRFTGLDAKSGAIEMQVATSNPLMFEQEFARFAKDPGIVEVKRRVAVRLAKERWTWTLGTGLADPHGYRHDRGGMGAKTNSRVDAQGKRVTTAMVYYEFDGARIELETDDSGVSSSADEIVQIVQAGRLKACRFIVPGKPQRSCKLELLPAIFERAPASP